jgi:hypothetical protein
MRRMCWLVRLVVCGGVLLLGRGHEGLAIAGPHEGHLKPSQPSGFDSAGRLPLDSGVDAEPVEDAGAPPIARVAATAGFGAA